MSPEVKIPKKFQSEAIFVNKATSFTKIKLTRTSTGTFRDFVGTADDSSSTITWEEITENTVVTLGTPNKALFYRNIGSNGAVMTKYKLDPTVV